MRTRRDTAVTAALIVVNAGVFFLMMLFYGDPDLSVMVKCGAIYGPYVRERQEYYRLFASMFLHFDFYHLMNNMVMLGALGVHLEPELGSCLLYTSRCV